MYTIIWEFTVAPEQRAEFVRRYASDGDWARLFSRSSEWQGTSLLADEKNSTHFFTVDRWASPGAWDRFKAIHIADYDALDRSCDGLTLEEKRIGSGVAI
jgi:hypothetical protein